MSFILDAWLSSIVYAFGSVVGKLATKHHINNPWLYNFAWGIFSLLCTLPLALVNHVGLPQDWGSMWLLGLANAVSGTMFILALYQSDVSIIGPLYNLRTPLLVLAGTVLFREVLMPFQWVLMGIIIIAGMLVNIDEHLNIKTIFNKRTGFALLAVLTSAWFNGTIKYASMHNGYWEVMLWSGILGMVFVSVTIPLFYRDFRKSRMSQYSGLVLSTVLFTVGLLFEVKAVSQNVSISMAIISLPVSMIIAIAFSIFAPKLLEKHTAKVYAIRITAAAVMFVAALGLSQ